MHFKIISAWKTILMVVSLILGTEVEKKEEMGEDADISRELNKFFFSFFYAFLSKGIGTKVITFVARLMKNEWKVNASEHIFTPLKNGF